MHEYLIKTEYGDTWHRIYYYLPISDVKQRVTFLSEQIALANFFNSGEWEEQVLKDIEKLQDPNFVRKDLEGKPVDKKARIQSLQTQLKINADDKPMREKHLEKWSEELQELKSKLQAMESIDYYEVVVIDDHFGTKSFKTAEEYRNWQQNQTDAFNLEIANQMRAL